MRSLQVETNIIRFGSIFACVFIAGGLSYKFALEHKSNFKKFVTVAALLILLFGSASSLGAILGFNSANAQTIPGISNSNVFTANQFNFQKDWSYLIEEVNVSGTEYYYALDGNGTCVFGYCGAANTNAGGASGTNFTAVAQKTVANNSIDYLATGSYTETTNINLENIHGFSLIGNNPYSAVIYTASGKDGFDINSGSGNDLVQGIQINSEKNGGQATIALANINYVTLNDDIFNGSSNIFTLYFAGPNGAVQTSPTYDTHNTIENSIVIDRYSGDGLSFAFQNHGTIMNVFENGSRLAMYADKNCRVIDFTYVPNPAVSVGMADGIYVTNPSENILFSGLDISGVKSTLWFADHDSSYLSNGIIVTGGSTFTDFANSTIAFGDGSNFTFSNDIISGNTALAFDPAQSLSENIIVHGNNLAQIDFLEPAAGKIANVSVVGNTFHKFTPYTGENANFLANTNGGTVTGLVAVNIFTEPTVTFGSFAWNFTTNVG